MPDELSKWIAKLTKWGIPALPAGDKQQEVDNLVALGAMAGSPDELASRIKKMDQAHSAYYGPLYAVVPSKELRGWLVGLEWSDFVDMLTSYLILRLAHMRPDYAAKYLGLAGGRMAHSNSGLSYAITLRIGNHDFVMEVDSLVGSNDDACIVRYSWCTFLSPASRRYGSGGFEKIKEAFQEGADERERALLSDTDV